MMYAYKPKRFPFTPRHPLLAAAQQSCPVILAVNWVFQGVRGMERKELSFRWLLEALLAAGAAASLLTLGSAPVAAVPIALMAAHTLNFLVNGQVWVCARYCRPWRRAPAALEAFQSGLTRSLRALPWLEEAVVIGSRAQGSEGERSDIDLRLVFPAGWRCWLRTNLLLLRLRCRAFLAVVPLDLYAYDSPDALRRFDQSEPLAIVLDRRGRLRRAFATRLGPAA